MLLASRTTSTTTTIANLADRPQSINPSYVAAAQRSTATACR